MNLSFIQTLLNLDLQFSRFVQSSPFYLLEPLFWFVTTMGNFLPMTFLLFATAILFKITSHHREAIYLLWSTSLGLLLSSVLKIIIARPRPTSDSVSVLVNLSDYSFPSSHCLEFVVFFGFLYFYINTQKKQSNILKIFKTVLLLLILLVGFSRIYLGAHWLSDCLAGYLLGYLILKITIYKYQKK